MTIPIKATIGMTVETIVCTSEFVDVKDVKPGSAMGKRIPASNRLTTSPII